MRNKGFTLIELLVVIAIIALLMAIIMPSLRAAKELASGAVCVSNQRQLTLAWIAYADDHDSLLVGGSNYYNNDRPTPYRWVEYPLLSDKDNPEVTGRAAEAQYTLDTRKNGIRAGRLFAYTGSEDVYHCPGDRNITKAEPEAIFRSYAITGLMNGEDFAANGRKGGGGLAGLYTPIVRYRSAVTAPGGSARELYVVIKATEIKSPGNKHVFIEEDPTVKGQKVNAGGFVQCGSASALTWWDYPAYYHNDSGTFGYADGHAERIRWKDPDTLKLIKEGVADPEPQNNEDLHWLARAYVPKP
jgi:prepilin-type N-terminal cleavage/methylation domain-containing protein/prepilin-type processing-associated H-X9-DG protein